MQKSQIPHNNSTEHFCGYKHLLWVSCRDHCVLFFLLIMQCNLLLFQILFATVDRQQTGSISIEALQEILTMALDKDLKIHTQLYTRILQTIDKVRQLAILNCASCMNFCLSYLLPS